LRTDGSEILASVEDARADWQHLRDQLVDGLQQAGHVSSERVTAAIRAVPRHVFVPGIEPERAYQNEVFPIKYDEDARPVSSSSQPAIMARMLDQLDVQPGQRVLEIGTGSGYNAALLGHLVGETSARSNRSNSAPALSAQKVIAWLSALFDTSAIGTPRGDPAPPGCRFLPIHATLVTSRSQMRTASSKSAIPDWP
jgi:hypothetical protein